MKSRSNNKEVVGTDYVLTFGKYKGKAIWWLIKHNSAYLMWLINKDIINVADDVYGEVKDSYWKDDMVEQDNEDLYPCWGDIF